MYLDVFGDFLKSPPYFGYNSAWQENPVLCIFFVSGTYTDSNWPGIFEDHYFSRYDDTKLWNHLNGVAKKERGGLTRPPPGRATLCLLLLGASHTSSKSSRRITWPINPKYKGLWCISRRRRRVDQKHRNSARFSHHRRGTLLWSRHRRYFLPLEDQEPHHHDEEGVVHLWIMGL